MTRMLWLCGVRHARALCLARRVMAYFVVCAKASGLATISCAVCDWKVWIEICDIRLTQHTHRWQRPCAWAAA